MPISRTELIQVPKASYGATGCCWFFLLSVLGLLRSGLDLCRETMQVNYQVLVLSLFSIYVNYFTDVVLLLSLKVETTGSLSQNIWFVKHVLLLVLVWVSAMGDSEILTPHSPPTHKSSKSEMMGMQ